MALERSPSLMSIYDFACVLPFLDIRGIYGTTTVNCIKDARKDLTGCHFSWPEYDFQRKNAPSRVILTQRLAEAERMLADYLGFWPGPHYEHGEIHSLQTWGDTVKLDYCKVIATGEQSYNEEVTSIGRVFSDPNSWGFNDTVTYEFEGIWNCNYVIFPESKKGVLGYELRHYTEVTYAGGNTFISLPVYIAIDPIRYNQLANPDLRDIDLCVEDNFPANMVLYTRSFDPVIAGVAVYNDQYYCTCGNKFNGTGLEQDLCQGCSQNVIPICLEPVNPDVGLFNVIPLTNTAEEGEEPCWERLIPQRQNQYRYSHPRYDYYPYDHYNYACVDEKIGQGPQYIKVNYLSGCGSCWGDECIPFGVCPDLKLAVAYLAMSLLPTVCDCGCLDDIFANYQNDWQIIVPKQERLLLTDKHWFDLGTKAGAVEAYKLVRRFKDRKLDYGVII